VIKTHRTFAYLDDRVVNAITKGFGVTPSKGTASFATALGVDERSWNAANKASRSLKRRHRDASSRHLCGKSSFPTGWIPTSAGTDGVSVCVTLTRPVEPSGPVDGLAEKGVAKKATYEERLAQFVARHGRPHKVAEDPGRVALSTTAQKGHDGKFVHNRHSRRQHLRWTLQGRRQYAEEDRRRKAPLLGLAIRELASAGTWMTTHIAHFTRMLVTQMMVHDILVTEYVDDVWYAKWRMLMWRRKRMVVMQYYAATTRRLATRNEPVVFGYGDSGFAASGRGEQAVPTSGKIYLLHRVARCLKDVHPVMVVPVDERCTTMKCHGCGNVLQSIYAPRQDRPRPLRGLKLCLHCTGHHVCEATRNDGHAEHETNVRLKDDDGTDAVRPRQRGRAPRKQDTEP
jgi:hypothetical protein